MACPPAFRMNGRACKPLNRISADVAGGSHGGECFYAAPRVMPLIFAMDAAMALNLSVVMPEVLPVRIKFFLNSSISVEPA